jgi:hypothetical protein
MFACKTRAYLSGTPFRLSSVGQATCLTHNYLIKLSMLARDKCSSLFGLFVNDEGKKYFITLPPGFNVIKLFFLRC